jgi:putative ABC transport system substrate-binding protein
VAGPSRSEVRLAHLKSFPFPAALGLIVGLVAAPPAVQAQPAGKVPRIGILCAGGGCPSMPVEVHPGGRALVESLRELGYVDGKNVMLDLAGIGDRQDQLPALARTLVHRDVAIIVALGASATLEAGKATKRTPIVMVGVGNAVELGLVASLARPGGNITGVSVPWDTLAAKYVQLLRDAAPAAVRVAVLSNPDSPADRLAVEHIRLAGQALAREVRGVKLRHAGEVDGALEAVGRDRIQALIVLEDWAFIRRRGEIVRFALRNRLPTIGTTSAFTAGGGLMSLREPIEASFRQAAVFLDKILKGRKPADLPVEQPLRYELVVNLSTAKAIGLTIPQSIIVQADRVIE